MNITKKKIYYKFVDLQRASCFLEDESLFCFANKMIEKLNKIEDNEFNNQSCIHLLNEQELTLINEYINTGSIKIINDCISKIPEWLWILIMPEFFNLNELRQIINEYNIRSKIELHDYYRSDESFKRFGKETSLLYAHFVFNQDGCNFPIQYRIFPNEETLLRMDVGGMPIKGNFHNHTIYSDGEYCIEELKELARKYDREYIGVSDHSSFVGGVNVEQLIKQIEEINFLNQQGGPIILKSIECEILRDGSLDMPDEILSDLDYVIVACHRNELMKKAEATNRIIRAVEDEKSNILAHPFSRIYRKKVGLYLDIHKVIDACTRNDVAIEINGDPDRLDLAPEYIQYAVKQNALFTVDSDTHKNQSFKNINNAIKIAEDYSIPIERILNIKDTNDLKLNLENLNKKGHESC